MQNWKIRIAPSLGDGFAGTPYDVWGVEEYENDRNDNTVFMGIYGLPDFYTLWRHKGRKCILWCGSDIQHFLRGYFLDIEGKMKIHPIQLSAWIDTYCENYVENDLEQQALRTVGIRSKVVPSFLGNVNDYPVTFTHSVEPKVYTSVSGDDFKLYGWEKIPKLARNNPNIEFHLYGNVSPIEDMPSNVYLHGRVSQKQMDKETKKMQGCLRLTEFDGFSELIAKALLRGQYPISLIEYPTSISPDNMEILHTLTEPNIKGRDWLLSVINRYPWNIK